MGFARAHGAGMVSSRCSPAWRTAYPSRRGWRATVRLTWRRTSSRRRPCSRSSPRALPPPSRMSYESGPYFLHYMIEQGVCYLTLSDRGYPKKLAYQYLEDLQREFAAQNGAAVETVARPYAFIKFDTFIQKTKKLYQDTRTQRNLSKLNEDLHDIQSVMTRNINDILGQGERLDHVSSMSETLRNESRKYSSRAKDLSRQALIQKYAPLAAVVGFVFLLLLFRRWLF